MARLALPYRAGITLVLGVMCGLAGCNEHKGANPDTTAETSVATPRARREIPATPIDVRWTEIPEGFVPSDPERVFRRLETPPRSPYETTSDYVTRTAALSDAALVAFELPVDALAYDADYGTVAVLLNRTKTGPGRSVDRGVAVRVREDTVGAYEGQNAFGATRRIIRSRRDVMGVSVTGGIENNLPEIPMLPDSARKMMPRLRPLLVLQPKQLPSGVFVTDSSEHEPPTMRVPFDTQSRYRILWASLIHVWLYDIETRQVVGKQRVN